MGEVVKIEKEKDWVFTFGIGQPLAGRFVVIHGTYGSARDRMVELFGDKWGFQYSSEEEAGVERWGYTELSIEHC